MSESQRRFAYGKDEVGECSCPAVSAGFSPASGDKTTEPARTYDYIVGELGYHNHESTISEEQAKNAWLTTIDDLKKRYDEDSEILQAAEKVAKELGWM